MAGMTPSLAIQGFMLSTMEILGPYHLKYQMEPERDPKAGRNAVPGRIDFLNKIRTVSLRCVSTSTCAVSIKPKIQSRK